MVLGLLAAVAAVPAVVGTTEAVRQGQRQNAKEEHRGRKGELVATLPAGSSASRQRRDEFSSAIVVLWRNKLWIRTNSSSSQQILGEAHPFTGYFLQHPKQRDWRAVGHSPSGEGLVSTISHEPPILNWVYVDSKTHEVKYGTRAEVEEAEGLPGPWDVTAGIGTDRGTGLLGGGRRVTFEGWEGFVAVEEVLDRNESGAELKATTKSAEDDASPGSEEGEDDHNSLWLDGEEKSRATQVRDDRRLWALYFDIKDDGLSSEGRMGSTPGLHNILEVELIRRERKRTRQAAIEERVDRLQQRKQVDQKINTRNEVISEKRTGS